MTSLTPTWASWAKKASAEEKDVNHRIRLIQCTLPEIHGEPNQRERYIHGEPSDKSDPQPLTLLTGVNTAWDVIERYVIDPVNAAC